ncbi:ClbS/DfsB family four-helix bundle protein, partial [Roseburia yibonii]|uniref:ClbS/DfsB family four-helix bundle protein n=1 Tax=Roseburia yibonii TaxID=2763063 RepID=UPI001FAC6CA4
CSGFRGEYFTLFCACSASGMTGTDVRAGSCRYLLNQQTLFTNTFYPWVGGSCIGSYFISNTSSHYDWAMKKMKAHKRKIEENRKTK